MHPTLITTDTDASPPNAAETYHTIADYGWLLERFTGPDWSVSSVEMEDNDHNGVASSVLSASLTHQSDSLVQCLPFDPWEHSPGDPVYRRHRIRLRDSINGETYYLTIDEADVPEFDGGITERFTSLTEHPYPDLQDSCTFHRQKQVHHLDSQIESEDPDQGRGYNVPSIPSAVLTTIAACQRISRHSQLQSELSSYA